MALHADYQSGLEAYQSGNYDLAFSEWIAVAVSNEQETHPAVRAEAQYAIGMMYWMGQGVTQDSSAAANWMRESAKLGHAGAQLKLGFLYLSGTGVKQSEFEAFKWLQMSANQGNADAQYNLGVMYRDGLGVEANADRALQWFHEAAAKGDEVSAGIIAEYEKTGKLISASPEVTQLPPGPSDSGSSTRDKSWVLSRNPEHFTIQVIALLNRDKLQAFIAQNESFEPFAILESRWNGRPLWVLLQGDYPSADEANAARLVFPDGLQEREKLWVRRFSNLQNDLR